MGAEFCQYHGRLVAEYGGEALKSGKHLPARRSRVVQVPVVSEETLVAIGDDTGTTDPALVRPRLAEAAAASLEDIRVLLETAREVVSDLELV